MTKALLAGWNISGILRYESGRPLNITMANDLGGLAVQRAEAAESRRRVSMAWRPTEASIRTSDRYFNRGAWTDPGPLQFGNAPRARRHGARIPGLQRGLEHLQGVPAAGRTSDPVRVDVRQHLQPDAVLRSAKNWSAASFGQVGQPGQLSRGRCRWPCVTTSEEVASRQFPVASIDPRLET